jgi:hypothetical protein
MDQGDTMFPIEQMSRASQMHETSTHRAASQVHEASIKQVSVAFNGTATLGQLYDILYYAESSITITQAARDRHGATSSATAYRRGLA